MHRPLAWVAAAVLLAACGPGSEARVTIPAGASMRAAAESLSKAGVVSFPGAFSVYADVIGSDRGIKAGTYVFSTRASWGRILRTLRGGGSATAVLVPEGYTLAQIEALLVSKLSLPADSVASAARDSTLLRRLDIPTQTLEGYLFPDTYFFPPGTTAASAVVTMVRRFERVWRPEWDQRLDTLALSRHDLVTLASIVEREARLDEERPVIAAVYVNRLKKGMRLEADPTVQYALPQYQKRLLLRHLTIDSPYNTYRRKGLPPGPIGAPGVASLRASVYPAEVPYLYFVAYPDGHHEFRVRHDQHVIAARAARRAWDALKTKAPATKAPATKTRAPGGGDG